MLVEQLRRLLHRPQDCSYSAQAPVALVASATVSADLFAGTAVSDLSRAVTWYSPTDEALPGGVRKVGHVDPDGNEFGFGGQA